MQRLPHGARRRLFQDDVRGRSGAGGQRLRRVALAALIAALLLLPRLASGFVLDLAAQVALAAVGALALNL